MRKEIPETDQWKLDGKCSICRRLNYCSHSCHANKESVKKAIQEAFDNIGNGDVVSGESDS